MDLSKCLVCMGVIVLAWIWWFGSDAYNPPRSLRGRNDRSEKVENRGQIFTI